ncbi:choloylglycine hydrolase family protein [Martelella lutilitoris]|uniref:Choloylglycine hydrolase family protein n=1 Tax=Martelella lutilitoris TaxID=2583532 RepID=A0A5C4JRC0_9HYPH|nr:choloylglycine hydrolase family protein [Martelella lutilitoris]TNB47888.1 choloylglycine hydrolase family protein [Martelella lutilitoris]
MSRKLSLGARIATCAMAASMMLGSVAEACTGITMTAKDGTVVRGRTMEFGIDIKSDVILVPRGLDRTATAPDGKKGKNWKVKYANVGTNALGMPVVIDGLNEKGLSAGIFYFMDYADYQPFTAGDESKTIAPWEVVSYILDNFATIEDVRAGIQDVVVPAVVFKQWNMVMPVHYYVADPSGNRLVIEYSDGKLNLYDDPIGTFTNQPTFPWHLVNLNNYVNLDLWNVKEKKIGDLTVPGLGEGTGLLGLPGDFTPPSRFVRAAIYSNGEFNTETGEDTVFEMFHILNNFDIPRGVVRTGREKDDHGNIIADYTQWTSANDTSSLTFYLRTYDDSAIRKVSLNEENLDAKEIKTWKLDETEQFYSLGKPE